MPSQRPSWEQKRSAPPWSEYPGWAKLPRQAYVAVLGKRPSLETDTFTIVAGLGESAAQRAPWQLDALPSHSFGPKAAGRLPLTHWREPEPTSL